MNIGPATLSAPSRSGRAGLMVREDLQEPVKGPHRGIIALPAIHLSSVPSGTRKKAGYGLRTALSLRRGNQCADEDTVCHLDGRSLFAPARGAQLEQPFQRLAFVAEQLGSHVEHDEIALQGGERRVHLRYIGDEGEAQAFANAGQHDRGERIAQRAMAFGMAIRAATSTRSTFLASQASANARQRSDHSFCVGMAAVDAEQNGRDGLEP